MAYSFDTYRFGFPDDTIDPRLLAMPTAPTIPAPTARTSTHGASVPNPTADSRSHHSHASSYSTITDTSPFYDTTVSADQSSTPGAYGLIPSSSIDAYPSPRLAHSRPSISPYYAPTAALAGPEMGHSSELLGKRPRFEFDDSARNGNTRKSTKPFRARERLSLALEGSHTEVPGPESALSTGGEAQNDADAQISEPFRAFRAPVAAQSASKLSQRRAAMADKYGEDRVTKLGQLKGKVRRNPDGTTDYFCKDEKGWKAAIYHNDIRDRLIQLDEIEHPEQYIKAPAAGKDAHDITSNCNDLDQHKWDFESEEGRNEIKDARGLAVYDLAKRMKKTELRPSAEDLRAKMYVDGKIVISTDNLPVRDLKGIPRCFSSQVEGGRIESLKRVFPWMSVEDVKSRQPATFMTGAKVKSLGGLSALRLRGSRFRDANDIKPMDYR